MRKIKPTAKPQTYYQTQRDDKLDQIKTETYKNTPEAHTYMSRLRNSEETG